MPNRFHLDLDFWVILFSLVIIRLAYFLGYSRSPLFNLVCMLPFVLVVIKNLALLFRSQQIKKVNPNLLAAFCVYLVLLGIAFLRSALSDQYSFVAMVGKYGLWLTLSVFSFLSFTRIDRPIKGIYLNAVFYGLILYILVNVVTYVLGFENPEDYFLSARPALMLKALHINLNRVTFPFSSGLNTFGIVAAAGLVVASLKMVFSRSRGEKVLGLLSALVCLGAILAVDSRGALVFALFTILLAVIFPTRAVKLWRWIPLVAPLLPLFVIFVQNYLPFELFQDLMRNPTAYEVDLLSGRQQIWTIILDQFKDFDWNHLIGYGYHGQVLSGLSQNYAFLFSNFIFGETASAHNFALQTLLDFGYVGFIAVYWLILSLSFRLAWLVKVNTSEPQAKIAFFLFFFIVLAGSTEIVLTPDHVEIFVLFIFLCGYALVDPVKSRYHGMDKSVNQVSVDTLYNRKDLDL